ncbi:hypothetical protein ACN4Z3_12295 [Legionella sp. 29fVS95]
MIRLRDAPSYLGMDRHRFNEEVRPNLLEIPIGNQGVAFDRLDLDAWVDDYIHCSGRPAVTKQRSLEQWDEKNRPLSLKEVSTSILVNVAWVKVCRTATRVSLRFTQATCSHY